MPGSELTLTLTLTLTLRTLTLTIICEGCFVPGSDATREAGLVSRTWLGFELGLGLGLGLGVRLGLASPKPKPNPNPNQGRRAAPRQAGLGLVG